MSSVAEVRAMVDRAIDHLGTAQMQTSAANDAREAAVASLGLIRGEIDEDVAHLVRIASRIEGNTTALNQMMNDVGDGSLQAAETATYSAHDASEWGANALAQAQEGSNSTSLQGALVSASSAKDSYAEAASGYIVMVNRIQEAVAMLAGAHTQIEAAVQQMPTEQLGQAHTVGYQVGMSLEAGYTSATGSIEQAQAYVATL
jgi:hypothetical protein